MQLSWDITPRDAGLHWFVGLLFLGAGGLMIFGPAWMGQDIAARQTALGSPVTIVRATGAGFVILGLLIVTMMKLDGGAHPGMRSIIRGPLPATLVVAALVGLLAVCDESTAHAQELPADPGPIRVEIEAPRAELSRVLAIATRLNDRLLDSRFLAEMGASVEARRFDDLADQVAEAAGVSPGWVKAGPGTARTPGAAGGRRPSARPAGRTAASPWFLRYTSRDWSWCIAVGTCPI